MLYMCTEYHIYVNIFHVSALGIDERMINVHYYYYKKNKFWGALLAIVSLGCSAICLLPRTNTNRYKVSFLSLFLFFIFLSLMTSQKIK